MPDPPWTLGAVLGDLGPGTWNLDLLTFEGENQSKNIKCNSNMTRKHFFVNSGPPGPSQAWEGPRTWDLDPDVLFHKNDHLGM